VVTARDAVDDVADGATLGGGLVPPHGRAGRLLPLLVPEPEREEEKARAAKLRRLALSSRETSDLVMLGIGAFTPLLGFMGKRDWESVCEEMTLSDGTFWPIPITASASDSDAADVAIGEDVALV
jgi:sulfate adenylyltransferase